MKGIGRLLSGNSNPVKAKSISDLRKEGLQLDPILAHSDDDEKSTRSSKVFPLRSSRIKSKKPERLNGAFSDSWEINYDGDHVIINSSGLSLIPQNGHSFLTKLSWEPTLVDMDSSHQLGRGACSFVFLGKINDDGSERKCAIKVFNLLDIHQQQQLTQEIKTLIRCSEDRCKSLIDFYGAFQQPQGKVNLVLEYMNRGSIQDLISRERYRLTKTESGDGGLFPERAVASIAYQTLQGLYHLHKMNFIHRDIKPSNLLVNSEGELKLTDFGILAELPTSESTISEVIGTIKYMCPARLKGEKYGLKADIWSFGLVLLECAAQLPFWDSLSQVRHSNFLSFLFMGITFYVKQVEMLQHLEEHGSKGLISAGRGHLSKRFVDVATNILHVDADIRASSDEISRFPWFITQGVTTRKSALRVLASHVLKCDLLSEAMILSKSNNADFPR